MIERIKTINVQLKTYFLFILYSILFWLLIGYIVLPICNTFIQAFQSEGAYSFDVFKEYISNSNNIRVVSNTFILGLGSIIVCSVMGIALALYMTFICDKYKKLIHILLLSPMMIPGVILVIDVFNIFE